MTKQDCLEKLDYIAKLESNWNGYGADSIPTEAINNVRKILEQISIYPEIYPTANDSVQMEHHSDKAYIEIECFTDHYELFCNVNDSCAVTNLNSSKAAAEWWNVLISILTQQKG